MEKPDVDHIDGLSPAISIQQRSSSKNPKSTVGTATEIYDYLRLLYSRIGIPYCPNCGKKIGSQSVEAIVESIIQECEGKKILIFSSYSSGKEGYVSEALKNLRMNGFSRVRLDGEVINLDEEEEKSIYPRLDKHKKHSISAVIDRVTPSLEEKVESLSLSRLV